jgi:Polysaccharide biosynthesis enzyme WcbI
MPDDAAGALLGRRDETAHRELIGRLESAGIGRRAADGGIAVRRRDPAGCILYGPYLHLPQGRYRLAFGCRSLRPRLAAQPVLGVEVLVLSRFQLAWRDFTAAELAEEGGALDFAVPPEHSLEGEGEGRFEFRFFHLGNADLAIAAVALERLSDRPAGDPPRRWRLLGRLDRGWRARPARDGSLRVPRLAPPGVALSGGLPPLRLPAGAYRLLVRARCERPRRPDVPALGIAVVAANRQRRRAKSGLPLARRELTGAALADGGAVALDFAVPAELSLEAGADAPLDIRLRHFGNGALRIAAVDLLRLGEAVAPAPYLRPAGRRRVVIVGGFQSETLRQGFVRIPALSERFDVRYHFVQLPQNLHEFAARDLETCDILLVQDIRLWESFPLRDRVRPGVDIIRYPLLRLASLWPFDAWNGPGDREALAAEAPNLAFPYLDGLLARLRREIPDREARFEAYRALAVPGIVNYRRLHQLELRRLAAMDAKFGTSIGDFIAGNLRRRPIFHTTVRPNWEVCSLLLQLVAGLLGVKGSVAFARSLDRELRNPQVPVHPKVARDLGVRWADERTRYLNHGRAVTWEDYVRSYIAHYG